MIEALQHGDVSVFGAALVFAAWCLTRRKRA